MKLKGNQSWDIMTRKINEGFLCFEDEDQMAHKNRVTICHIVGSSHKNILGVQEKISMMIDLVERRYLRYSQEMQYSG